MELKIKSLGENPTKEVLNCPNPRCGRDITVWYRGEEMVKVSGAYQRDKCVECQTCGQMFIIEK